MVDNTKAKFDCSFCEKSFKTSLKCNYHTSRKHKRRLKICDVCNIAFLNATSLSLHKSKHVTKKDNVLKCSICPRAFFNKYNLVNHESKHGFNRQDEGIVLKYSIQSVQLPGHKDEYIGFESPFVCSKCEKSFNSQAILDRHISTHDSQQIVCQKCNVVFSKDEKEKHDKDCAMFVKIKNKKSVLKMIQCERCTRLFANKDALKRHMISHTRSDNIKNIKKYVCKYCPSHFKLPIRLFDHYFKSHPDEEPFCCLFCDLYFKKHELFSQHIQDVHKNKGVIKFDLDRSIVFRDVQKNITELLKDDIKSKNKIESKSTLEMRKKYINPDLTRDCHYCGLKLLKTSYRRHIYRHHKRLLMRNKCHLCPMTFISKSKLNWHVHNHFKNDLELCKCGVKCKTKEEVLEHRKICPQSKKMPIPNEDIVIQSNIQEDTRLFKKDIVQSTPKVIIKRVLSNKIITNKPKIVMKRVPIEENNILNAPIRFSWTKNNDKNDDIRLINVNPLAHLIQDNLKQNKIYYKTKQIDYESIIKRSLDEFTLKPDKNKHKDVKKKKYYKSKEYDYVTIIKNSVIDMINASDKNETSTGTVNKIDLDKLVKESLGDEVNF